MKYEKSRKISFNPEELTDIHYCKEKVYGPCWIFNLR
jgi:hypothetical protein